MHLDGRTLFIVATLATGLLSMFGVVLWSTGRSYPGCRRWIVGHLILAGSLLLLALRGKVPDVVSVLVANAMLYTASAMIYDSLGAFRGLVGRRWPIVALGTGALAAFACFEFAVNDINTRILISGTYLGIVLTACGVRLLRNMPAGRKRGLALEGSIFLGCGMTMLIRGVMTFEYARITDLFASSGLNWTGLALAVLSIVGWSLGFVLMVSDRLVADLKHAQGQLKHANAELQAAVEHADRANLAKSQFLANVSHEIRTPIAAVISFADLLLDSTLDPTQRDYVTIARDSGAGLLSLVNGLLDLSKIEAGKLDLEESTFRLDEILQATAGLLAVTAKQKGIDLRCHLDRDVPRDLIGDPDRLRQILTNLCGNAVKFISRGHVTIQVSVDSESTSVVTLRFAISDTGPGIPKAEVDQLFQRFAQAGHQHNGTGLGLAISKQLVELMGGKIGVESVQGRGSTFWFTVLLKRANRIPVPSDMLAISAID